jgi:hypothetical protein
MMELRGDVMAKQQFPHLVNRPEPPPGERIDVQGIASPEIPDHEVSGQANGLQINSQSLPDKDID